jgi:hypothetical protein
MFKKKKMEAMYSFPPTSCTVVQLALKRMQNPLKAPKDDDMHPNHPQIVDIGALNLLISAMRLDRSNNARTGTIKKVNHIKLNNICV